MKCHCRFDPAQPEQTVIARFGQNSLENTEVITFPDPVDPANTTKITSRLIYALCNPNVKAVLHICPMQILFSL